MTELKQRQQALDHAMIAAAVQQWHHCLTLVVKLAVDTLNIYGDIVTGDFNQLADGDVMEKTGLLQIVRQPTRGTNLLDRVFVSHPIFCSVRVVASAVRSDHKAIVAYSEQPRTVYKTSTTKTFRPTSPAQHAIFIRHTSSVTCQAPANTPCTDTQYLFDAFYMQLC